MASRQTSMGTETQKKIRATAIGQALGIEEKKKLKNRVADLVIEAYDLPSSPSGDPARPLAADAALFQECLRLFQPSDLDDLIKERNIDNRCGYALCPKPNQKIAGSGEMVWNQRGGRDFQIVARAEMEKWCSKACGNRTAFVRAQLNTEPAWLREQQNTVKLLDEIGHVDDLAAATKALAITEGDNGMVERMHVLSLERGEDTVQDVADGVVVVEKADNQHQPDPPSRNSDQRVEGHQPRKVRFAQTRVSASQHNFDER